MLFYLHSFSQKWTTPISYENAWSDQKTLVLTLHKRHFSYAIHTKNQWNTEKISAGKFTYHIEDNSIELLCNNPLNLPLKWKLADHQITAIDTIHLTINTLYKSDTSIENKYWKLSFLKNHDLSKLNSSKDIYFIFQENHFKGFTGSIDVKGTFSTKKQRLQCYFDSKKCNNHKNSTLEFDIFTLFEKSNYFEVRQDELFVFNKKHELLARWEAIWL